MPFLPSAARLLCLFSLPFTVLVLIHSFQLHRPPSPSGTIPVDPSAPPWNSSSDPIVIAHLTDLHISPHRPKSLRRLRESLDFIRDFVNPTFTVLTGDLTDNLQTASAWSPSYPIDSHWQLYHDIVANASLDGDRVIEILGNHDTWARLSFDARYFDYMLRSMADSWFSQSYERDGVRVVTFQPIVFPTGRGIYLDIIPLYPAMLEAVEQQLALPSSAQATIFASHFPFIAFFPLSPIRSRATGRNLLEILWHAGIEVFINGHTHPKELVDSAHFGSLIQLTGAALSEFDGVSLLTIDNGRVGYDRLDPNGKEFAVVTSPCRDRLATRVFPDEEFDIRVVSFSRISRNFSVSGAVTGQLKFQRKIESGGDLYALRVRLGKGYYSIEFSGDLNRTVNFTVGIPIASFDEYHHVDIYGRPFFISFLVMAVALLLFLLSYIFLPHMDFLERVHRFMNREIDRIGPGILFVPIGWPFFMAVVVRRLPKLGRRYVLFMAISAFVLPFGLTKIADKVCLQFAYGFLVNGVFRYDAAAQMFGTLFAAGIVAGSIGVLALFAFKWTRSMLLDVAIGAILWAPSLIHWESYGREEYVNGTIWRVSPGFHVFPILSIVVMCVLLERSTGKSKPE